jgi:hypothetical protein
MAQTIRIEAVGTRKMLKKLDSLPAKIRTKIVRKVISKATTVMKRELIKRVPIGVDKNPVDDNGKPRKRLKKSVTKRLKIAKGKSGVHGVVGLPYEFPKFVFMLHYGIKPHTISAFGRGLQFQVGGVRVFKSVNHPGVQRMDFYRQALAASIPKSRTIMATALRTQLASVTR